MIKVVDEIPQTLQEKRESYRDMIRKDINDAVDNNITKFEFEGDYNYKYLAQYAREEASRIYQSRWFRPTERKVVEALRQMYPIERYFSIPGWWKWEKDHRVFRIKALKGEGRTHVYCEIDYSAVENLYDKLLAATIEAEKDYQKRKEKREQIRNAERSKDGQKR